MDIAKDSLDIVAWSLTELLEKLHKVRNTSHSTEHLLHQAPIEYRREWFQDD